MSSVFFLYHREEKQPNGFQGRKLIGVYSTAEKAREAVARIGGQPGFREHPEDWYTEERLLDRDDWAQGFDSQTHRRL